ncbi:MAG TPA: 4-(cytidine 5'-diphospho)-2-C-methyl-D-erythritol kinase [bacterium]|nr:4-(cytidine 5'-diphospho)-2-C-methyl-D-erythritol kinase [bacterium]
MMNPAMNPGEKGRFCLAAPAKVNLGLKITGKRPDGYHDLQSLMVPLSFGDTLAFEALPEAGTWEASCDHPDVPVGEDSLVARAFRFAAGGLGYEGGLRLLLKKAIPMGAGLGGGSSDAAAVMRAVELLTGRNLAPSAYPEIAYKIGADVPFFLTDGAKWVLGIGEEVRPVASLPPLHLILIHPDVAISTKWVYSQLKINPLTTPPPAVSLRAAFESMTCLCTYLTNDLESVVLPHYPVVGEAKEALKTFGADAALMSGSGSTVFGLYSDPQKRDEALRVLKAAHPEWWVAAASNLL